MVSGDGVWEEEMVVRQLVLEVLLVARMCSVVGIEYLAMGRARSLWAVRARTHLAGRCACVD